MTICIMRISTVLHLGKVAVTFGPFDPSGNEGSLGDPSGNEGSPPLRERRDPSPGGTLVKGAFLQEEMKKIPFSDSAT